MKIFDKDAYILAFFTGLLYICAYLSALAKANYYDLPMNVISIDIFSLTSAALIILYVVFCLLGPLIFSILYSHKVGRKPRIIYLIMAVLALSYCAYWYASYYLSIIISLAITVFCTISMLAFIYIKREKFKRFINKNSIHNDSCNDEDNGFNEPHDVNGNIEEASNGWVLKAVLIAAGFFAGFSYVLPYLHCMDKTDYDVFSKEQVKKYALIVGNNDTLIAKEVINGKLGKGYYIFKAESLNGVQINNVDIRNLTP